VPFNKSHQESSALENDPGSFNKSQETVSPIAIFKSVPIESGKDKRLEEVKETNQKQANSSTLTANEMQASSVQPCTSKSTMNAYKSIGEKYLNNNSFTDDDDYQDLNEMDAKHLKQIKQLDFTCMVTKLKMRKFCMFLITILFLNLFAEFKESYK
jgi:hypothetical protein